MFQTENKDGNLYFSGCEVEKLAEKYGTPIYIVSEDKIRLKCSEVRESFLNNIQIQKPFMQARPF